MIFAKSKHTMIFAGGIIVLALALGREETSDQVLRGAAQGTNLAETADEADTPAPPATAAKLTTRRDVVAAREPATFQDDDAVAWSEPELIGDPMISTDPVVEAPMEPQGATADQGSASSGQPLEGEVIEIID